MGVDDAVEIDLAGSARGRRGVAGPEVDVEDLEGAENEADLGGRFAALELGDPEGLHANSRGEVGLGEAGRFAAGADEARQILDGGDPHGG